MALLLLALSVLPSVRSGDGSPFRAEHEGMGGALPAQQKPCRPLGHLGRQVPPLGGVGIDFRQHCSLNIRYRPGEISNKDGFICHQAV